jgi:hypothetical protein
MSTKEMSDFLSEGRFDLLFVISGYFCQLRRRYWMILLVGMFDIIDWLLFVGK